MKPQCACFEYIGDNLACPIHAATCDNCGRSYVLGVNGVTNDIGNLCDKCYGVIRNSDGMIVESFDDALTDMEQA
jgi:hypothetical protein